MIDFKDLGEKRTTDTLARLRDAYQVATFRLAYGYGDIEECRALAERITAEEAAFLELVNFKLRTEDV